MVLSKLQLFFDKRELLGIRPTETKLECENNSVLQCCGQIIATSHDLGPQMVV